mgnify:CR=1 FL=1
MIRAVFVVLLLTVVFCLTLASFAPWDVVIGALLGAVVFGLATYGLSRLALRLVAWSFPFRSTLAFALPRWRRLLLAKGSEPAGGKTPTHFLALRLAKQRHFAEMLAEIMRFKNAIAPSAIASDISVRRATSAAEAAPVSIETDVTRR